MRSRQLGIAVVIYAVIVAAFWIAARHSGLGPSLGAGFPQTFASLAVLLAPLWFFAFGSAEPLRRCRIELRAGIAGLIAIPYFVLVVGTPDFQWRAAVTITAFPVLMAGFLGLPKLSAKMAWRDAAALAIITAAYFLRWFHAAWPGATSAMFPKLFLADVALYCFLVARRLDGMGYSLIPTRATAWAGIREWLFYFPFAVVIGEATGFIHLHVAVPTATTAVGAVMVTFLLIALPEELFFRGILQNLLETRLGRSGALIVASVLFGLSHFNHGSVFNWRYVLLATIAGIFYGRAWRAQRQIFAAVLTHALVDVVWSLWFR
ncbi:MAG TPA: CPBP family intramembrane glutamic endopeptidase [Terriglobales bacterium]|nr:CPBP family intramembrane glutamic endopeptidase [Terriglobales bacterium]